VGVKEGNSWESRCGGVGLKVGRREGIRKRYCPSGPIKIKKKREDIQRARKRKRIEEGKLRGLGFPGREHYDTHS